MPYMYTEDQFPIYQLVGVTTRMYVVGLFLEAIGLHHVHTA